jgi:hypothetical protein
MQNILQLFVELLQVPGGDLDIVNCACFTVFHRKNGGRATLLKIQDYHPQMTITYPHSGETKTIAKKDHNQAHKDLGWMMNTDGKSTAQFKVLKQKAKVVYGAMLQSRMQCYDATTVYNLFYLASISYTISGTRIYLDQCKTIHIPVVCGLCHSQQNGNQP